MVVVTGANGLVGARVVRHLLDAGAHVRAVVRREGAAPEGTEEHVGEFGDPEVAASVVAGASAVVSTVHPLGGEDEEQRRVAVESTPTLARAARDAGVPLLVHVSTAAVYDRSPSAGDVDEQADLVGDDADVYATTKRDADAALAEVEDLTTVLVRPPAVLGPGATSVWNTKRPAQLRDDESERHAVPERAFAWVHVDDLARLVADVALGRIATSDDPDRGPVEGGCTVVNAAAAPATVRDYVGAVTGALGVDPVWEEGEAWTGRIVADRAHAWGWQPRVSLAEALDELREGISGSGPRR
ncbi:SDR family oxidoreductase [Nocardioides marmoribigeumensis]